jgi:hypothetical protein
MVVHWLNLSLKVSVSSLFLPVLHKSSKEVNAKTGPSMQGWRGTLLSSKALCLHALPVAPPLLSCHPSTLPRAVAGGRLRPSFPMWDMAQKSCWGSIPPKQTLHNSLAPRGCSACIAHTRYRQSLQYRCCTAGCNACPSCIACPVRTCTAAQLLAVHRQVSLGGGAQVVL